MQEPRYAINVRDPAAKCTRNCLGTMNYDGPCDDGCCDDGYPYLSDLPPVTVAADCARHDHVLITPENEARLVWGCP